MEGAVDEVIAVTPVRVDHAQLMLAQQLLARRAYRLARRLEQIDFAQAFRIVDDGEEMRQATELRLDEPHQLVATSVNGGDIAFQRGPHDNGRRRCGSCGWHRHAALLQPIERPLHFLADQLVRAASLERLQRIDRGHSGVRAEACRDRQICGGVAADNAAQRVDAGVCS